MDVGGQQHVPASLFSGKRAGTHCTGGVVGPGADLEGCANLALTRILPRTVKPVASRYTDWAIPAHHLHWKTGENYTSVGIAGLRVKTLTRILPNT